MTLPRSASGQTSYQVVEEPHVYAPLSGAVVTVPGLGDSNVHRVDLPFDFVFYGQRYRSIWINANGFLSVVSTMRGHNFAPVTNPAPRIPNGFIAPLWADWCSSADLVCSNPRPAAMDTGVYYVIDRTPGAESIRIEWRSVRHFQDQTRASAVTFSVSLHAGGTGEIRMAYGAAVPGVDATGGPTNFLGRIGIEDPQGAQGRWVGPCVGPIACRSTDVQALVNRRIRMFADAGEDLTVGSVSIPTSGFPGLPLSVSARYSSLHGNLLGPTRASVVLLPRGQTATTAGTLLATSAPITLSPFESRVITLTGTVPANFPPAGYHVAVVADADHALSETDETNNVARSVRTVRITGRSADFVVPGVSVGATEIAPGDPLSVRYTLANVGNEPAEAVAAVYLSSNPTVTTADRALGARFTRRLQAGETFTVSSTFTVPQSLSTGVYSVGVVLDPDSLVPELDETNNVGVAAQTLTVTSGQVAILTDALPVATLTVSYSGRLSVIGGDGTYTFRLTRGNVPRGLLFRASAGEIFGIPLETGSFPLEFEVRSGTVVTRKTVDLTVIRPDVPLSIATRRLPAAAAGADYAVTPRVIGGIEPYRWRVLGRLPDGLNLATDGTIIGTPRSPGIPMFGLEVTDGQARTASVALSLEIRPPRNLSILPIDLPDARAGEPYRATLSVSGGRRPFTWSNTSPLPPTLSLSSDGELSGQPEKAGRYRIAVQVVDADTSTDTNALFLRVVADGRLSISPDALPPGEVGQAYQTTLQVTGGEGPYIWGLVPGEGRLPAGFSALQDQNDFVISGDFPTEGVWPLLVEVTDREGRTSEGVYALVGRAPEPAQPEPPETGQKGCICARVGPSQRPLVAAFGFAVLALFGGRRRRR